MGRNTFQALLADIRHDLEVNDKMAELSSGSSVYPYLQLAICLRYLAGTISLLLLLLLLPPPLPPLLLPGGSPSTGSHFLQGGSYLDIADVYKVR
jgi:hypothetical protein